MRHHKRRGRLGKQPSHRAALVRNTARNLLRFQSIRTTLARAKQVRRLAEKMVTLGKRGDLAARRKAFSLIPDREICLRLFKEIAPLFKTRIGGYTRIIPIGFRKGDGAQMVILELTEKKIVEKTPPKKKEKAKEAAKTAGVAPAGETHKPTPSAAERKEPEKPKTSKIPPAPRPKATMKDESKEQKAKAEEKKFEDKKGFLKNLRGYFRRKTDM